MTTSVTIIPILKDNYAYLLQADNGARAIIDPGEAAPIIKYLDDNNINTLDYVINTHHHWDHVDGNAEMLERYGAVHVGPQAEEDQIGPLDIKLIEGDKFSFGGEAVQVIETPGHTMGHICFYFPESKLLFAGDTILSMGCGRLFEGAAEDMWNSLEKLIALPDDTDMYCGHEYTLANSKFCLKIEPDNEDLKQRIADAKALRKSGKPTLPVSMGIEKKTNVFLKAGSVERFAELREQKDNA